MALEAISHGVGEDGAAVLVGVPLETLLDELATARRLLGAKDTPHAIAEALRRRLIR